jgi:PAS domain-containing protein
MGWDTVPTPWEPSAGRLPRVARLMAAPWTRPDAPRMMAAGALAVASRMPSMSVHVPSHQQADALMKQEDEFSAAILETVAALVAVFDRAGHVVQFNRACQQGLCTISQN